MEVWKDIPGYEGQYQASTLGNIRSLGRKITQIGNGGHEFTRAIKGRLLRPGCSKYDAHLRVALGRKTKKYAGSYLVHQLVALTFLGPRPEGMDIRHLDGNVQNNAVTNLCYGTRTENILDVYYTGRAWRKLTLQQAQDIKTRAQAGESTRALAQEYGVTQEHVCSIKAGDTYGWL